MHTNYELIYSSVKSTPDSCSRTVHCSLFTLKLVCIRIMWCTSGSDVGWCSVSSSTSHTLHFGKMACCCPTSRVQIGRRLRVQCLHRLYFHLPHSYIITQRTRTKPKQSKQGQQIHKYTKPTNKRIQNRNKFQSNRQTQNLDTPTKQLQSLYRSTELRTSKINMMTSREQAANAKRLSYQRSASNRRVVTHVNNMLVDAYALVGAAEEMRSILYRSEKGYSDTTDHETYSEFRTSEKTKQKVRRRQPCKRALRRIVDTVANHLVH
jgi:hypothetical protein